MQGNGANTAPHCRARELTQRKSKLSPATLPRRVGGVSPVPSPDIRSHRECKILYSTDFFPTAGPIMAGFQRRRITKQNEQTLVDTSVELWGPRSIVSGETSQCHLRVGCYLRTRDVEIATSVNLIPLLKRNNETSLRHPESLSFASSCLARLPTNNAFVTRWGLEC